MHAEPAAAAHCSEAPQKEKQNHRLNLEHAHSLAAIYSSNAVLLCNRESDLHLPLGSPPGLGGAGQGETMPIQCQ